MKITDVRVCQPESPGCPDDWRNSMGQILVAVDTDAGLTGYGVGGGGLAGVHVVQTLLRDCLMGQDPLEISARYAEMQKAIWPIGSRGLSCMALSGADLALWDLKGKAGNCTVAELLGGKAGRPIPVYVTVWDEVKLENLQGSRAVKLHVEQRADGADVEPVVEAVRQAREVIGPEGRLMLDAWMRWDLETTLRVAEHVAEMHIEWIEEPLPPDDLETYRELGRCCSIPIAGGEHSYTAAGFHDLMVHRVFTVLQPDVTWCGGMSALVKIYEMAHNAGMRLVPHRGAEVWGLHALAALDDAPLAESGRPWVTWIEGQPPVVDGTVTVSDRPGFGITVEESALRTVTW